MKLRVKAVIVLSLFGLFSCGGSSSNTQPAKKLISAEGELDGYRIESSYTYDHQERLTGIYTKKTTESEQPLSSVTASEYQVEYDDNGNISRVQLWTELFENDEIVNTQLSTQCDYTYVENKLTGYIQSQFDSFSGMVEVEKKSYDYNDAGQLETIEVYRFESDTNAFSDTPFQMITKTYDVNENVIQVESKFMNSDTPFGNTYVIKYNTGNQMEKHEKYTAVDLDTAETPAADETFELVYDDAANTVVVTDLSVALEQVAVGFPGKKSGYLHMSTGFMERAVGKLKSATPMSSASLILAPAKLVMVLSVSLLNNDFTDPISLLATEQLITESSLIDNSVESQVTTVLGTTFDENGYPETMTLYDFDLNFIWE